MQTSKEELILKVLREGRKQWADLERELVKSGKMALGTLSNNLKSLEMDGKIKRIIDYSKRPPVAWYMLTDFHPHLDEKVKNAVEELRREFMFLKEPSVKEVAVKVGELPERVRPLLFNLAPKIGWIEQDKDEVEKEAEKAINLAGWMMWLQKGEQNQELAKMAEEAMQTALSHTVETAKRILENVPQIVPEAKPISSGPYHHVAAGLEWREETLKAWQRVFKSEPPAPTRPGLWIVPR